MPVLGQGSRDKAHAMASWGALAIAALVAAALVAGACAGSTPSAGGTPSASGTPSGQVTPSGSTATLVGDCCAPPSPSPYGLVTARPSRDPAAPVASETPTPAPTRADALSQDATNHFDQMVAARASITVPIDFEGSPHGTVVVYARSKGLSVTFAGKALKSAPAAIVGATGMAFSADWNNPTDGNLVVKNTTGAPMEAMGGALILTRRHLTSRSRLRNRA